MNARTEEPGQRLRGGDGTTLELHAIAAATGWSCGQDLLVTLAGHLAAALGVDHCVIAHSDGSPLARTLAVWSDGGAAANFEFDWADLPAAPRLSETMRHATHGMHGRFPAWGKPVDAYLEKRLVGRDGRMLGSLFAFGDTRLALDQRQRYLIEILAARAAAEIDRLRVEKALRDSEQRLQDLFDEAPIAYVHETLDLQFIRANRAALGMLGVQPAEVRSCNTAQFIPATPDAQRRFAVARSLVGRGQDVCGTVLEMRRRSDSRPLWIQWWSRPDPGGCFTRTMFIDITDRVLLEGEHARLQEQNRYLREEIRTDHNFDEIVGTSPGMLRALDEVRRVAPTDATVLILGETGTGKELIARAIHSASLRAGKPFIKINCAAMPSGLIESELFGHERGAFSGAVQRRIGRFELANGGTIFLDEIGEVSADMQVKLLRVLQEREFERVGGSETIRTDVRVIAATNRDLARAIDQGAFRADLYYRLNVFPLRVPSLRERRQDIPLLAQYFVQRHAGRIGARPLEIDPGALQSLCAYGWPGNIRELENLVERALVLNTSPEMVFPLDGLVGSDLPPDVPAPAAEAAAGGLDDAQRNCILAALKRTNWVVEGRRGAAVRLGVKPATLRHRMRKLGILRPAATAD